MQELKINLDDIKIENTDLDKYDEQIKKEMKAIKHSKPDNSIVVKKVYENEVLDNPYTDISTKQLRAIELKIMGESKKKIAEKCGVGYSVVLKWFKDDEAFLKVYDEVKNEVAVENQSRFASLQPLAIERLEGILNDQEASDKSVLSAIKIVLENSNIIGDDRDKKIDKPTQIVINGDLIQNNDVRNANDSDSITIDKSNIIDVEVD